MARITRIAAREVLDSRGDPTVEADVQLSDGSLGRAIVPAGASTGRAEARELRDGDPQRYDGRGVLEAVEHVNRLIGPALVGHDALDQQGLDRQLLAMDGTPQKTHLGANALLGVSLAAAHAAASAKRVPLYRHLHDVWCDVLSTTADAPVGHPSPLQAPSSDWCPGGQPLAPRLPLPMTNMISGGLHAGGNLDFQDFLILPVGAPNYPTALEWLVRVARRLGKLLTEAGHQGRLVGDEGGYGPRLASNHEACEFLVQAIRAASLRPGDDVALAIDVASSHFFDGTHYRLKATGGTLSRGEMIDYLAMLAERYPLVSIEDGLAEDDWEGWQELTARLGRRVRLVGDDLLATNETRLKQAIDCGAANSILIKLNQAGTLSETLWTMRRAALAGYFPIVSARSGETEDSTIADLAVATAAPQIKIGGVARSERLAKYNRLLRIAEELGER